MSSERLFQQLTFVLFAFVVVPVSVAGSPTPEEQSLEENPQYSPNHDKQEYCQPGSVPKDIQFFYYTSKYPEGAVFDFDDPPTTDIYDSAETKVLTHGFRDNISSWEFRELIKGYLNRSENINVLALDWNNYTQGKYREAAKASITVGQAIATLFCVLYNNYDIYPFQMHFIGHNLGAHLLAFTAREAHTKVGRITGLDPARLCFEDSCHGIFYQSLNKDDARFVDILHTDAGGIGMKYAHGAVDFYANGGKLQPRCHTSHVITSFVGDCDAKSAYLYFAESILRPEGFYGTYCETPYPNLNCNTSIGAYMGEHMSSLARGVYSFKTAPKSPFGEGKPHVPTFLWLH